MSKSNTVKLGSLGISVYFTKVNRKTKYRTLLHPEGKRWTATSKRWCLNMRTLTAEYLSCQIEVSKVSE